MSNSKELRPSLNKLRLRILELAATAQEGHIPSAFSILDLVWVWFAAQGDRISSQDRLILSKGHGSLGLYVVLEALERLSSDTLDQFCEFDSNFGGHPDRCKLPEVIASTGSLGHGLPIAVGLALNYKNHQKDGLVCCLIGDGESNEGSIWEAALVAAQLELDNLICVVDNNRSGERAIQVSNKLYAMFEAAGWKSLEIDGHNHQSIFDSFFRSKPSDRPVAIIANTTKGLGVDFMENNPEWHHKTISLAEVEAIRASLCQ